MFRPNDVVVLEDELVRALGDDTSARPSDYVATGLLIRCLLKYTNIDFLYIFQRPILDVPKLKRSLQEILVHYPTLAGRVAEDGVSVYLNNQGAAFRVQEAPAGKNSSVYNVPTDPATGPPFCCIPSPEKQIKGQAPLLTVTVTKFDDGWALGVVMNHLVADAWTFSMFMKDWSTIFNGQSLERPVAVHLPNIVTQKCSSEAEMREAAEIVGDKPSSWGKHHFVKLCFRSLIPMMMKKRDPRIGRTPDRILLHYSDSQVRDLKEKFHERAGKHTPWVSTNEALICHIWKLLLDAAQVDSSQRRCIGFAFPVNLRGKLPSVSDRVAGNVITSCSVVAFDMNDDDQEPVEKRLHDEIRSKVETSKLEARNRLSNAIWAEDSKYRVHESKKGDHFINPTPGCLQQWNWQGSNAFFHVDFGTGRPLRGIVWDWNTSVTVLPGVNGGLDVYIDLSNRGPVQWKEVKKKWWSRSSRLLAVTAVAGSLAMGMSGPNSRRNSLLWLVTCGLLYRVARAGCRRDIEASKKEFCDYVRANAYASIEGQESVR